MRQCVCTDGTCFSGLPTIVKRYTAARYYMNANIAWMRSNLEYEIAICQITYINVVDSHVAGPDTDRICVADTGEAHTRSFVRGR